MRTVERFAFLFGIVNLALGVLGMFSPFVSERRPRGIRGLLPRRKNRGLINRREGQLLGMMGAVNPPHAMLHTALGTAGVATRPLGRFSRAYLWLLGGLYAAMAVMGWTRIGFKPGVHNIMGLAVDWRDNIIHTLLGGGALLLAARPNLGQRDPVDVGMEMANAGMMAD